MALQYFEQVMEGIQDNTKNEFEEVLKEFKVRYVSRHATTSFLRHLEDTILRREKGVLHPALTPSSHPYVCGGIHLMFIIANARPIY